MTKNNGGPAYPTSADCWNGADSTTIPGMSLRDAIAIAALTGLTSSQSEARTADILDGMIGGKLLAQSAYMIADAMLAERDK